MKILYLGIGKAVAQRAATAGAPLSITARNAIRLERVVSKLQVASTLCSGVAGDIGKGYEEIERLRKEVVRRGEEIDIVIVCAGINQQGEFFGGWHSKADEIIEINFRGVVHICEVCLPVMRKRGKGKICVLSSLSAYRGLPGASVYGATKAAITSFCQSLNAELHNDPVELICVHPGFVETDAIQHLEHPKPFLRTPEDAAEHVMYAIAFGRQHYGFPWIMEHVITAVTLLLPTPIYNFLLSRTSGPPTQQTSALFGQSFDS